EQAAFVLVIEGQLGDGFQRATESPRAVIEIAVIDVGRQAAAAVGGRDQAAIPSGNAPCLSEAERGIPASGDLTRGALQPDGLCARPARTADAHERCPRDGADPCTGAEPSGGAGPCDGAPGDRTATTQRTCSHSPPGGADASRVYVPPPRGG